MGTRSTIKFYKDDKFLCGVYQQYDGYISGVGKELVDFFINKKITNGFHIGQTMPEWANGFTCAVAQFIAEKKTEIGGFYMTDEEDSQEYNYKLCYTWETEEYVLEVESYDDVIFTGTLEEFIEKFNTDSDFKEG